MIFYTARALLVCVLLFARAIPVIAQTPREQVAPVFRMQMYRGMTQEAFLVRVLQPFRHALRDRPALNQTIVDETKAAAERSAGRGGLVMYLGHDQNLDAIVTEEEIRFSVEERLSRNGEPEGPSRSANVESEVRQLMKADKNGSGFIELHEMQAAGIAQSARPLAQADLSAYLAFVPKSSAGLTASELLRLARSAFEAADADRDTVISAEELSYLHQQVDVTPAP